MKRRISGNWGHLSNKAASDLLAELKSDRLRRVVAMHLSQENNHPELVRSALARHLDLSGCQLDVAHQDNGTPWLSI
ncbi:MAG: hypothetical protein FJY37_04505 [Betaproteobacteria bacterium]|nr:hypothetical protein [Betaproteobacteria bacterium]